MQISECARASVEKRLRTRQRQVFTLCWLIYALAYLGRNNLAAAMTALESSLGAGKTGVAMLGTLFYWCYACGKLVSGYLGDYVNNKRMVLAAVAVSGTCNMLMGAARAPWLLTVLWGLNGLAQSALWCNILRVVSRWFRQEEQGRLAIWLSTSMMAGSLAAYAGCGFLIQALPYSWSFFVPGALLLAAGAAWLKWGGNDAAREGFKLDGADTAQTVRAKPTGRLWPFIVSSGLLVVTVTCLAQGMVKDSIGLWGPVMLEESFHIPAGASAAMLWALPLFNLGGVTVVGVCRSLRMKDEALAGLLMALCLGCLVGMRFCADATLYVVLLSLLSAFMYGVNTLLLTLYPLRFAAQGRVSFVSGFLDASAYLAAGLGSLLLAGVLDSGLGWPGVYALWMGVTALSLLFLWLTARFFSKSSRRQC